MEPTFSRKGRRPLATISQKIKKGAQDLGTASFQLPLAINYEDTRKTCVSCTTFAILSLVRSWPKMICNHGYSEPLEKGMELRKSTVVKQLIAKNGKITEVVAFDKLSGEEIFIPSKKMSSYLLGHWVRHIFFVGF
ncbi:MAG: hypothetical protein R2788_14890 [Saprospiraceae bacterium]